jgi:hypothetical protein
MNLVNKWVLTLTVGCFLGAQALTEDPVVKARLQRAQAQGIEESDLPPVPRGVVEPPPLPPPEIHAKDAPHPKVAKATRHRGAGGAVRTARRAAAADPAPAPRARSTRHGKAAGGAAPAARPARKKTPAASRPGRHGLRRGQA